MSTEETRSEGPEPTRPEGPERRGPANGAGVAALVLGIVGVVTALTHAPWPRIRFRVRNH